MTCIEIEKMIQSTKLFFVVLVPKYCLAYKKSPDNSDCGVRTTTHRTRCSRIILKNIDRESEYDGQRRLSFVLDIRLHCLSYLAQDLPPNPRGQERKCTDSVFSVLPRSDAGLFCKF
jgi:hypothetical protein